VGIFNEGLRTAIDPNHHEPLFADVSPPATRTVGTKGEWNFNCTLKGGENQ
jgi:hypothetical protein